MSYLVMEIQRSYAIVLDNEGRFLKVANLGYEVGQKVDFVVEAGDTKVTPLPMNRQVKHILFAVASVFLLFVGSWPLFFHSIGTVRMQINPDVEMTVNRFDNVIGLDGLNPDGDVLVKDIQTFGRDVDEVSNALTERALELGFLSNGDEIHLTVVGDDDKWIHATENRLRAELDQNFQHRFKITVENREQEPEEPILPTTESTMEFDISIPSQPVESDEADDISDDLDDDLNDGGNVFEEPEYVAPESESDDDLDDDNDTEDDDSDDDLDDD